MQSQAGDASKSPTIEVDRNDYYRAQESVIKACEVEMADITQRQETLDRRLIELQEVVGAARSAISSMSNKTTPNPSMGYRGDVAP